MLIFRVSLLFFLQSTLGAITSRDDNNNSKTQSKPVWTTLTGEPSLLIGHRGEKVLMPEHTLGSYNIACILEPDYVEPDLLMTKDEHFICHHDLTLKNGTNVASIPALEHLKGLTVEDDWYILDFTLEEVRMLKVVQQDIGIRPQYFNDLFTIPTFEEYLVLIGNMSYKMNRTIGIIPELKSPRIINERLGKPNFMEDKLLQVLREFGYPLEVNDEPNCMYMEKKITCGPLVIQSFNKDSLKYLSNLTDADLMMLIEYDANLLTLEALTELAPFVTYYSVWKEVIYSGVEAVLKYNNIEYNSTEVEEAGGFIPSEDFSKLVHSNGMKLGIYTIYDSREPSLRGCEIKCAPENKTEELFYYFGIGVDAVFVENIKEASDLRMQYYFYQTLHAESSTSSTLHQGLEVKCFFATVIVALLRNFSLT